jgi:hypothetical protein
MILVTGDVVLDHNIYEGKRLTPDSTGDNGTLYTAREGGAKLAWRILNALKPESAVFGLHELPTPEGWPESFQNGAVWESALSDTKDGPHPYWSLARNLGYGADKDDSYPFAPAAGLADLNPKVLVIDDGALGFRREIARQCWPPLLTRQEAQSSDVQWIVLKVSRPFASGPLWETLAERWRDKLLVIATVGDLRNENVRIARGLSWESTVDDIVNELDLNPAIRGLQSCRHLIVTVRGDAALWLDHPADTPRRRCQLIFDRERCEGQWEDEGRKREAFGFLSAVTASVAWGIAEDVAKEKKNPDLTIPISAGLSATRFLWSWGHGPVKSAPNQNGTPEFPFAEVAEHIRHEADQHLKKPEHLYVSAEVRRDAGLTILGQISPWRKAENLPLHEPAKRVAILGPGSLLNVPCARFEKLQTMDRREIDSLRSLRQMMLTYQKTVQDRPLCLAVFGAPGSGKSFGLKQVADGVFGAKNPILEFNLSQFKDADDLIGAFHQVRDHALAGKTPAVFWDEFDSEKLKWLRYFLAPMQDGAFQEGQLRHSVGKCVFVFAGGTSWTFEEFRTPAPGDADKFVVAKGPDFVSRIAGFLDIAGPNRRQKIALTEVRHREDDPADIEFPIRRAMTIRVALKLDNSRLEIDPGLLMALLKIGKYQNGARSMANLLSYMSSRAVGSIIRRTDLPPDDILELYVDSAPRFHELILEHTKQAARAEMIAPWIHQDYRDSLTPEQRIGNTSDVDWDELTEEMKDSNRLAAMRMPEILSLVALKLEDGLNLEAEEAQISKVIEDNLEKLAESEHGGWEEHKRMEGWTYGEPRLNAARKHDLLKPYALLPEEQKHKDRQSIRNYPKNARKAGFKIVPTKGDGQRENV